MSAEAQAAHGGEVVAPGTHEGHMNVAFLLDNDDGAKKTKSDIYIVVELLLFHTYFAVGSHK